MKTTWGDIVRQRLGMTSGELFTPKQASDIVVLSVSKVRTDIETGTLPAVDINGQRGRACWRVTRADIAEYVRRIEQGA